MNTNQISTDFLAVATAAIQRGFKICPVHPNSKAGDFPRWNTHPIDNLSKLDQLAQDYPHHKVGIVGRRGIGNHVFVDIDAPGVEERIVRETGQPMPNTYVVQSRPQTAPYKKHFYFTQTFYSLRRLGKKEINVKDLTVTDEGKHPTLYDIKGSGGGGFVVAAGSVRENGEVYTALNDLPIAPIPDWLVDWIADDHHKFLSAKHELRKARQRAVASLAPSEREALQKQNVGAAFDVSEDDAFYFLNSRAGSLASLGVEREDIEVLLAKQAMRFVAGGKDLVQSKKGKRLLHEIAFNPKLRLGNASWFKKQRSYTKPNGGLVIVNNTKPKGKGPRARCLQNIIAGFPDGLPSTEAYDRLQEALRGTGYALDRTSPTDLKAIERARRAAGFRVKTVGKRGHVWLKGDDQSSERTSVPIINHTHIPIISHVGE